MTKWIALSCFLLLYDLSSQAQAFRINPVPDTIFAGTPIILSTNINLLKGTPITISKNDRFADIHETGNTFPIGFNFRFFSNVYDYFCVGSNGYVTFENPPYPMRAPFRLPPDAATPITWPRNCILGPFKNYDYETTKGEYVFYITTDTSPNRKLIVYWCNIPVMESIEKATFQIVLNENGEIDNHLIYLPRSTYYTNLATQGIVDASGTYSNEVPGRNYQSWIPLAGIQGESWKYTPQGSIYQVSQSLFTPVLIPEYILWYEVGNSTAIGYKPELTVWPKKTTTYRAEIYTCWNEKIGESTVTVEVHDLLMPFFSPSVNSFGLDVPVGVTLGSFSLQVYNRWGQRVFSTSDITTRWNGRMNNTGADCPTGVYPWVLIVNIGKEPVSNKGFVTLVR